MDVTAVNDEFDAGRLFREFGHAIEINEEGDEDLVGSWTVLEDTEEIGLEGDCGCRASMECEVRGRSGKRCARRKGEG